ncbi:hypothetical protein Slin_7041 (plasmid) [Spirosoma linguale DSM 74]|uniref:Uncharacterized protein n=1 Tax=Spirosoma linguale (strain ATCC 33905 / DSM 74 / LMG 10896 / Claus 1) TaxID=504472 RepID=D2QW02_SPILD|nr:hypothetical protein Slin_7041 [Spirosoma linguale DSM 74]
MQRSEIAFRLALYKTASRLATGWLNVGKGKVRGIYRVRKLTIGQADNTVNYDTNRVGKSNRYSFLFPVVIRLTL